MKYFIRSVKYFFWFSAIFILIVSALVFIGVAEGDINVIFRDGYNSLWKIGIFFALVAAVYPRLGFMTGEVHLSDSWDNLREDVMSYMRDRRYDIEQESADENGVRTITFKYRGIAGRLSKMNEDRITFTISEDRLLMEGLRKEVLRLSAGIEHLCSLRQS